MTPQPAKRMPIGLDSAADLFGKVRRDRAALEREVTPDALFNFVITAHALCDWIQKDPAMLPNAKEACASLAKTNEWLRACRDLANGSKHLAVDRYEPLVEHADAVSGYGAGRYGFRAYGQGEWPITVSWGGATCDALAFVTEVATIWADFFQEYAPATGGAFG